MADRRAGATRAPDRDVCARMVTKLYKLERPVPLRAERLVCGFAWYLKFYLLPRMFGVD